jgi:ATP-binding cassette, subfamily B (MDR/TAP), member 1
MADSRPSTADEKAAIHKPKGFFSRRKSAVPDDNVDEKGGIITTEVKPVVPELAPVAFSELFRSVALLAAFSGFNAYLSNRYSTKYELFLNAIGLLAAIAAGAAQVCTDSRP